MTDSLVLHQAFLVVQLIACWWSCNKTDKLAQTQTSFRLINLPKSNCWSMEMGNDTMIYSFKKYLLKRPEGKVLSNLSLMTALKYKLQVKDGHFFHFSRRPDQFFCIGTTLSTFRSVWINTHQYHSIFLGCVCLCCFCPYCGCLCFCCFSCGCLSSALVG